MSALWNVPFKRYFTVYVAVCDRNNIGKTGRGIVTRIGEYLTTDEKCHVSTIMWQKVDTSSTSMTFRLSTVKAKRVGPS